jgi:hypothetical protein
MSFDIKNFQAGRGAYDAIGKLAAPTIHMYSSTVDNMAAIVTSGYFDYILDPKLRIYVLQNDLLLVSASDQVAFIQVTSISPTITTAINVDIPASTITTAMIQNLAVTNAKLALNSVASANIIDATIVGTDIAAATIAGSNIAAATVTGSNIAGTTITGANIALATIDGANIQSATIDATNIAPTSILRQHFEYCSTVPTVAGSATQVFNIVGVTINTMVFALLSTPGASPETILSAKATAADTVTVIFSGDPASDHVVTLLCVNQ